MHIPFSEMLKSIPGAVGIRLEEELPYSVLKSVGDLEIREYRPFTLARVTKVGDYDSAANAGFRSLAEFIFGKNDRKEVTEMTTPVFMDQTPNGWTMSFYIPEEHASLKPNDSDISIESMPAKTCAVYSFSGVFDEEAMRKSKAQLLELIKSEDLLAISEVWWAQFDQPVSIPATKRNEALVKISYAQ